MWTVPRTKIFPAMKHRHLGPIAASVIVTVAAACGPAPSRTADARDGADAAEAPATEAATAQVRPGIDVLLRDSVHLVRGKRVGFLTNQTAVTADGRSAIDVLAESPDLELVALYGPEHGLRGGVEGGETIESGRDSATGVPVHSLYGETQRPTPEMLDGVEVLVFDMQDIGARPYTFVWTMAMAMEAAAQEGIPFIVLDRPNPITAAMEGPLMEMAMRDVAQPITGYFPVPLRHGMTVGEIARYVNEEYDLGAELTVVPVAGWRGDTWFDETGLPWIDPSPNIRSLEAALHYAGVVLAEGTNVTVGRGTARPMSYLGAPWMDAARVLEAADAYDLPGVALDTTSFVPEGEGWVPFRGERVNAIELRVVDRDAYRPVWTALVLLSEIKRLHPDDFQVLNEGFTQMIGARWAREAFDRGEDPREIWRRWEAELAEWRDVRERYRLYPGG